MNFNIPIPPSDNQLYNNSLFGRTKTVKYLKFLNDSSMMLRNKDIMKSCVEFKDKELFLYSTLFVHRKTMFCKNGKRKRFDITNRTKASNDLFSKYTGIDDMFICEYKIQYVIIPEEEKEHMNLLFCLTDNLNLY